MFGKFTEGAQESIRLAQESAIELGHSYVGTEHLLLGLVRQKEGVAGKALENYGVAEDDIIKKIEELLGVGDTGKVKIQEFTPRTKKILEMSLKQALNMSTGYIGTEHILLALLEEVNCVAVKILATLDVNMQKLYDDIINMLSGGMMESEDGMIMGNPKMVGNRQKSTPTLDKFSRDLTSQATDQKLDPVIGRGKEIERVIQILSRRTKNNPCLIGEPGVGKTAVIEALAQQIVKGDIPETLKGKRVVTLDISSMVAGSKYRGEFEGRIKKCIEEVRLAGNVILFIDEIHTIIGAGAAEGSLDAANILKPSLARGELQVIGATTYEEYRKHIEKDSALERRFQPVKVEEPSEEDAILILKGLKDKYEAHHEVQITDEAINAAVRLSSRYITDRFLPDKAIDVIDEASSKVRLRTFTPPEEIKEMEQKIKDLDKEKESAIKTEQYEKAGEVKERQQKLRQKLQKLNDEWKTENTKTTQIVTENEISDIIASWTGIPVKRLEKEESKRLMNMEEILHTRVVGQDEAVKAVSKAIRRGRVGLKDPKRPVGSFVFLGPTGVGKTELSKALSEVIFGDENALIRIDMSEYMEKHSVSKLIGSPPGYVGHDEGGHVTEKIRRKPYSVILLDEIEKAHPDVFNILLQVLDDGHITDSQGRKVDFKNAVIIMTSNIGAANIISPKKMGFVYEKDENKDYTAMKKMVMEEVKKVFKPEFLNRIDEVIVFHSLTDQNIREIVKILFEQLKNRIKNNVNINIKITDEAIENIAKSGFDQQYGARPLKRTIQSKIEDKLAEMMLDGEVKEDATVTVEVKDNEISLKFKNKSIELKKHQL
ncbi:MAG TPA: ATP-dependent Clp protease ATP-binding subunit ClpC [Clostridiales bacterium]|nr:MAG: ATP-dependent Clp protease ATP-binding subunit ClpC [Clostridiales bacterium GWD2_32_19]HCC08140.1 ATP-dependent Clp protease ATP-binding subunit ClpC [Clostridiales bacterium]